VSPKLSFLFRTDCHVSDRNPESWRGDYPSEVWSNLVQVGNLARAHAVRAVLDGGDYFHVKAASRTPHSLVERTARIHEAYPCPVWSIEGNHDITYNSLDSVPKQPIGVLYASKVFHQLRETVFEEESLRVRVVGLPYSPFRSLDEIRAIRKKPGDDHLIVVCHQLAGDSPPDTAEDFFGEPVFNYEDLIRDIPDGPSVFCFGHWHKDLGVSEIGSVQFVNTGALSRGALVRDNLSRTPKVTVLEVTQEGVRVREIPLQVPPAVEVFDLARKERQEREGKEIEQFVQHLQANANTDPSAKIEDSIESLSFAKDVMDLAKHYLERARSEAA
jgi:DNA repair exonuclease SbcCD nuclease subunit